MSKIIFKTPVLYRLSRLYEAGKKQENIIRFEVYKGKLYAIGTNGAVSTVEYLGESSETDMVCHINLNNKMMKIADDYRYSDTDISIELIPEIASGTLVCDRTMETSCFYWPESTFLNDWKDWFVELPNESSGFMFWNLYQIQCLYEASPSGELIFPAFFDSSKPVPVQDANNPNWFGFFIPSPKVKNGLKPVEKPEWWLK